MTDKEILEGLALAAKGGEKEICRYIRKITPLLIQQVKIECPECNTVCVGKIGFLDYAPESSDSTRN